MAFPQHNLLKEKYETLWCYFERRQKREFSANSSRAPNSSLLPLSCQDIVLESQSKTAMVCKFGDNNFFQASCL